MNIEVDHATKRLSEFAERIKHKPDSLGRFFNTISYLEHLGSRKILACPISFAEQQLQHAAEETRHALRFKRLATYYDARCDSYDCDSMFVQAAAFGYFQRLDCSVRSFLTSRNQFSAETAYLLVTYLIEKRAESLYPVLKHQFADGKPAVVFKSIIREEDRHLQEMERGISKSPSLTDADLTNLRAIESALFDRFVNRLVVA